MPGVILFPSGANFVGPLSATEFYPPAASIKNAAIAQVVGEEVGYEKLEHLTPLVYRPPNRQQRLTLRSQTFDLTSSTGKSLVLLVAQQAITILEARIVYDVGSTDTVTDGSIKLGTAAAGSEVFAATSFENSKAAGSETTVTLADATHAAGSVLHLTYAAPAAGVTGEAHLEIDYQIDAAANEPIDDEPLLFIARKAGTIVAVQAVVEVAPTSSATVTIDLLKSTAAGAFATALTTPIVLDSSSVARTPEAGVINSPDMIAGDLLKLDLAVAGAIGNQGTGLAVVVWVKELP